MSIFKPSLYIKKTTNITPEMIFSLGAKGVLVDVDNTIARHDVHEVVPGVVEWFDTLKKAGIKCAVISNNSSERIEPIVKMLDLPSVGYAKKPLEKAYARGAQLMGLKIDECVMIGDQIFTDILGANMAGMKSILVVPISSSEINSIRLKRKIEQLFLGKMRAK